MINFVVVIAFFLFHLPSLTFSVNFNYEGNTAWAPQCDFVGQDLSNAQIPAENCGPRCLSTSGCTHFSWTTYNGGTCWMKSGWYIPSDSISTSDPSSLCGFVLDWAISGNVEWAPYCDFNDNDLSNALTTSEDCGGKCASTSGCTHFTWSDYNGGTCWMKTNVATIDDAYLVNSTTVCGIVGESQPERLRIVNGASSTIFIFYQAGTALPYANPTILSPGAVFDVHIDDGGLKSTRFWPGWGCNQDGTDCKIGASGGVFPGGHGSGDGGKYCPSYGCAPAVDSKFECTFGDINGGIDWLDISLVDGYTLPYTFNTDVPCIGGSAPSVIDCRGLSLGLCPVDNLGSKGTQDLSVRNPQTNFLSGCFSPCSKLTFNAWNPFGNLNPADPAAEMYCCPTPPVSPQSCSSGPVVSTQYVNLIHRTCPGVYAYAYDDQNGLSQCKAGTKYEVTFYDPMGVFRP